MALNPSKLKTLVDQHSAGPNAAALGMAPAPGESEDDIDVDDDMDDEEPAGADPAAMIAEWGEFGETLTEEADALLDNATELGGDLMLKEIPPDVQKKLEKSVDRMPDELSMGLAKYVSELSPDDCDALCTHLAGSIGEDADEKLLCAYVYAASQYAKEAIDVDEDFNEPEEDEDAEKDEEAGDEVAEGADVSAAPPVPPEA